MIRYFFSVVILFSLSSCATNTVNKGEKITEEINYNCFIGDPLSNEQTFEVEALKPAQRKELIEKWINDVFDGKIKAYLPIPNGERLMTKEEIDLIKSRNDTVEENIAGTEETKKIPIVHQFNFDAVTHLKFKEKWFYNEEKNIFSKEVTAVCPLVKTFDETGEIRGLTALFWIYFDDHKPKVK